MDNKIIEKLYPYVIPIIIWIILVFCYYHNGVYQYSLIVDRLPDLLNVSLTISGISLGFIGTMIGAILSITNSNVMSIIYSAKADNILMNYIKEAAIVNLLILFLSIFILLAVDHKEPPAMFIYLWIAIFISSFLCSFRIIYLLFALLTAVNKEYHAKHTNIVHTPNRASFVKPNFEDNNYDED